MNKMHKARNKMGWGQAVLCERRRMERFHGRYGTLMMRGAFTKNASESTNDWSEVTCKRCLAKS